MFQPLMGKGDKGTTKELFLDVRSVHIEQVLGSCDEDIRERYANACPSRGWQT